MKWPGLVAVQDISPEGIRPGEVIGTGTYEQGQGLRHRIGYLLDTHAKAITTMEHHVH